MRIKSGLVYYSITKKHFCVAIDEHSFRDLTTGDEFYENDENTIRSVMPEDLLDTPILIEMNLDNKNHYIRLSYDDIKSTKQINELISIDINKDGKLIGIKLDYPWGER